MPELPEVEVLRRHLVGALRNKVIRRVEVRRARSVAPTPVRSFVRSLVGSKFMALSRRGKYLLFSLQHLTTRKPLLLLGHLGMTGRIYLLPMGAPWPKHAAVILELEKQDLIFEDTRYFGRLTLDASPLARLGPEPLEHARAPQTFAEGLRRSIQPIKVKLLDQSLVAGVGNIYASEALFRAKLAPKLSARKLKPEQVLRLWESIREVLTEAINCGSTVPMNFSGTGRRDGLFYFGRSPEAPEFYEERLQVYDRAGKPCLRCGARIQRLVQASRSTYFCPKCQR
jgi:formamidopyrimidine-DNA glycosylase